jgi:competence protein ComEA
MFRREQADDIDIAVNVRYKQHRLSRIGRRIVKHNLLGMIVLAASVLLSGASFAADTKPAAPTDTKSGPAAANDAKAKRPAVNVKLVDINSASKAELKKLPNIDDAKADKIIAGRPYLSKAHLVTRQIIPHGEYEMLKKMIIAKQKPEPAAKPVKK